MDRLQQGWQEDMISWPQQTQPPVRRSHADFLRRGPHNREDKNWLHFLLLGKRHGFLSPDMKGHLVLECPDCNVLQSQLGRAIRGAILS